ncbi:MAG: hypothetical protein KDA70_11705 [Planctomycetaceae bacterium]|nr:hypothetical protein [Planctomycetaceae bacterium]
MTTNVLSILFSLLILVCPFNCMPEDTAGTETTTHSCCSHCQSQSEQLPLAPASDTDCCQCLCSGAIQEQVTQLDNIAAPVCWITLPLINLSVQTGSIEQIHPSILAEPVPLYGRALRSLHMSFQC